MIRRPPRSTQGVSSAASDVYKRQIYYYISVIKMMVVKEPQEASDVVKAYPDVNWSLMGMQPLRVALIGCVAITAVGGILSNPLFQWANTAVAGTPLLQQAIALSSLKGLG